MALIKCSECGKEVSEKADICPNCGNPIKNSKKRLGCLGWTILGVIALIIIGYSLSNNSSTQDYTNDINTKTLTDASTNNENSQFSQEAKLKLVGDWHWKEIASGSFVKAEGQIKNISDKKLKNVEAVITWKDKDGNIVTSEDVIIEYNPIMPGQTSPWHVTTTSNPEMDHASLSFKNLLGGKIKTKF